MFSHTIYTFYWDGHPTSDTQNTTQIWGAGMSEKIYLPYNILGNIECPEKFSMNSLKTFRHQLNV